jgi:hypothetical protein
MSVWRNSWSLETSLAPAASANSEVMFWLHAMIFMPKARPIRATCPPILPSPTTPKILPLRSWPTDFCQPPFRIELFS